MPHRHLSHALRAPIVDPGTPLLSQRAETARTDKAR